MMEHPGYYWSHNRPSRPVLSLGWNVTHGNGTSQLLLCHVDSQEEAEQWVRYYARRYQGQLKNVRTIEVR